MCAKFFTGALALDGGKFSDANTPVLISGIECIGNESSLLQCEHSTDSQTVCGSLEQATAVCQGMEKHHITITSLLLNRIQIL